MQSDMYLRLNFFLYFVQHNCHYATTGKGKAKLLNLCTSDATIGDKSTPAANTNMEISTPQRSVHEDFSLYLSPSPVKCAHDEQLSRLESKLDKIIEILHKCQPTQAMGTQPLAEQYISPQLPFNQLPRQQPGNIPVQLPFNQLPRPQPDNIPVQLPFNQLPRPQPDNIPVQLPFNQPPPPPQQPGKHSRPTAI